MDKIANERNTHFMHNKIIGITGNISSGKTTMLKLLKQKNYLIFNSDEEVKKIYETDEIKSKLQLLFPENKALIREDIARAIINDAVKRELLQKLIHPHIKHKILEFIKEADNMVFVEIPLLYEKNYEKILDKVIFVKCPKEIRKKRAINKGVAEEIFDGLDNLQWKEEEKESRADIVINGDQEISKIEEKIDQIIKELNG